MSLQVTQEKFDSSFSASDQENLDHIDRQISEENQKETLQYQQDQLTKPIEEHRHTPQITQKGGNQDFAVSPTPDNSRQGGQFQQETFDFKPYGNTILYKGDNEDSMWLGDGISTFLQDENKTQGVQDRQQNQQNNYFQARQNMGHMRNANNNNANVYNIEASRDGLSLGNGETLLQSRDMAMSRSYTVYTENEPSSVMVSQDVFKIIQERKVAALTRLKEWEEARVKLMNEHRGLCERVFQVMKRKIEILKEGIRGLFVFFFERIKQEENFAKTVLKNLPRLDGLFEEFQNRKRTSELSRVLQESDFYHQRCINRGSLLAKYIERSIIQEILVQEEKRFNDATNPLLENFRKLRRVLVRENEKAYQLGKSYLEIYKKSINTGKSKEDLFALELKFLKQAHAQLAAQQRLGDFTADFVGEVKINEIVRSDNCAKALRLYIAKMNELYHIGNDPEVLALLQKFDSQKESDERFMLDLILKKEQLDMLGKVFPDQKILTSREVIMYLQGLKFPELPANPLIFFDSDAPVEKNAELVGPVGSHIAITVDGNLIVYDLDLETRDYKVHREMKSKTISLKDRREDCNIVEFTENRGWFFGKVIKHIQVTFNNIEEKQEFLKALEFFAETMYIS